MDSIDFPQAEIENESSAGCYYLCLMPGDLDKNSLLALLSPFGSILKLKLPRIPGQSINKGYGYVKIDLYCSEREFLDGLLHCDPPLFGCQSVGPKAVGGQNTKIVQRLVRIEQKKSKLGWDRQSVIKFLQSLGNIAVLLCDSEADSPEIVRRIHLIYEKKVSVKNLISVSCNGISGFFELEDLTRYSGEQEAPYPKKYDIHRMYVWNNHCKSLYMTPKTRKKPPQILNYPDKQLKGNSKPEIPPKFDHPGFISSPMLEGHSKVRDMKPLEFQTSLRSTKHRPEHNKEGLGLRFNLSLPSQTKRTALAQFQYASQIQEPAPTTAIKALDGFSPNIQRDLEPERSVFGQPVLNYLGQSSSQAQPSSRTPPFALIGGSQSETAGPEKSQSPSLADTKSHRLSKPSSGNIELPTYFQEIKKTPTTLSANEPSKVSLDLLKAQKRPSRKAKLFEAEEPKLLSCKLQKSTLRKIGVFLNCLHNSANIRLNLASPPSRHLGRLITPTETFYQNK